MSFFHSVVVFPPCCCTQDLGFVLFCFIILTWHGYTSIIPCFSFVFFSRCFSLSFIFSPSLFHRFILHEHLFSSFCYLFPLQDILFSIWICNLSTPQQLTDIYSSQIRSWIALLLPFFKSWLEQFYLILITAFSSLYI